MGIQTAAVLYPVNTTTVDTGTGIDIRLLDSAEAGADDDTQTATATHTQDNVERTFDPATAGVTANTSAWVLSNKGWALRLTDDMTPTDDTNCNAILAPSGNFTVNITVAVNQAGGTYTGGTYAPLWRVALYRYDPATDTGPAAIAASANNATTWDYTPATGDLGTFKTIAVVVSFAAAVEFSQGEILLLQVGVRTQTIPNPTVGTATWTYTLRVDNANTNITWVAGQGIRTLCPMAGTVAGVAAASGVPVIVLPQVGTAAGTVTVSGALQAGANMAGSSAGVGAASGALQADANMAGTAAGIAAADADMAAVLATVGTVDIGAGGSGDTLGYSRSRVVNA